MESTRQMTFAPRGTQLSVAAVLYFILLICPALSAVSPYRVDLITDINIRSYSNDQTEQILGVIYLIYINTNLEMVQDGLAEFNRRPILRFYNNTYRKTGQKAREAVQSMWSLSDWYLGPRVWRKL